MSAINILLAINTHCHLISSKQLSSNRFRFHKTRTSIKYLANCHKCLSENIYNMYIKYTCSVNDFPCNWFYFQSSQLSQEFMKGERISSHDIA